MGATFLSRILGFIRIALISALFGATGEADVLNTVFTIPNNLRKLLAEGALSSAFIPVLSSVLVNDKDSLSAKKLVRNVLSFQLCILIPFSILCVIFADPLIRFVLVEFEDPALIELSVNLFRWFIHYLLLISISAVLMAVLNSHNSFVIPAITPILFSVAVITSILMLYKSMGIFSMAVGVLGGGLLQILFQFPFFKKIGYDFKPAFAFKNENFMRILKGWLPVVATASIFTINQQIAARFATGLETGSSSSLHYALVFFQLPFGIFSASITTVLFPRMSRQFAAADLPGLRESIQYGLRFLIILLLPSALFLTVTGKQLIAVALQRGVFTGENTVLTARVLFAYSLGLFSVGGFTFFQRFFYSIGDWSTPFRLAVVVCAVDIGLSLWLKETALRVTGLAAANSISFTLGLILMIIFARKKTGTLNGKGIAVTTGKVVLSLLPAALFLFVFLKLTGPWWQKGSTFASFGLLFAAVLPALGIILLMYFLLKTENLHDILKRRVKN